MTEMTDRVPKIWDKATCVIIGSGPSLSLDQISRVYAAKCRKGVKAIAVNSNYLVAPWADILYACDYPFWQWHFENGAIDYFEGLKATVDEGAKQQWPELLRLIGDKQASGLSQNPKVLHCGKNSGYQAVNLAYLMGAARILLIGFDHRYVSNRQHWHANPPYGNCSWYEPWLDRWQTVADQIAWNRIELEVINCTPDSALKCFPMQRLKRCL